MKKQLFNFTSEEERKMRRQAIPVAGIMSDLEVASHGKVLQPTYSGYGCPAKEERTPGKAGPKTHPVF